jgi:hypothetical protein
VAGACWPGGPGWDASWCLTRQEKNSLAKEQDRAEVHRRLTAGGSQMLSLLLPAHIERVGKKIPCLMGGPEKSLMVTVL